MLSITLAKHTPPCTSNSGGVSRAWVFDPQDFSWTQAAATATVPLAPYTAVALSGTATLVGGSGFYPLNYYYLTAEYKATHSVKMTANKWTHTFTCFVPYMNNDLINFLTVFQAANNCSSLGLLVEDFNGSIWVIGEGVVNTNPIPGVWRMIMNGSELTTGKALDDDNGSTVVIKGDYNRPAVQFTGGLAAILALQETV